MYTKPTDRRLDLYLGCLALLAAAALGSAYALQYLGGYLPCTFCYWQRYPYFALIAVVAAGLALRRPVLTALVAIVLLLVDAGIALWHTAIERGFVPLPESCAAVGEADSIEALKAQLLAAPPACDQVGLTWLGLSLSSWNALFALALAAGTIAMLLRDRRINS